MPNYKQIVDHYEGCLKQHGDNHKGVDWPNIADVEKRYRVMLDLAKFDPGELALPAPRILDFGCGAAHLLAYMHQEGYGHWHYTGLDMSAEFIGLCRQKFPGHEFFVGDVLQDSLELPPADYVLLNGVLNEKRELSFDEMWQYTQQLLQRVFPLGKRGMAFNVMSKAVDWERDDLFHLPIDLLASFLTKQLSRHFIVRNDYGLYEYTVYLYH